MNFDWQTILALLCVAFAAAAVAWRMRGWLDGSAQSGCGAGCQSCPARKEPPLVQIEFRKSI